jgi:phospholipase/carboxylesterase
MNQENLQTDLSISAEIKLYYDLFIPEKIQKPAPLLLAVHGYGAHKRYMMREARAVAPDDFVIAALGAPHQHFRQTESGYKIGFGWLTDYKPEESVALHQLFLLEVIENLANRNLIDRNKIFLYGFSQACALNFRFAFTNPEILRGILAVCGGIPSDLDINEKYKPFTAETFYLYGDADEFYPLEKFQAFERNLKKVLPRFQSKKYSATHEITDEMREDIKSWLLNIMKN